MATHILGIRHHGPGSAAQVKHFLEKHSPDVILVEGPPEASEHLYHAAEAGMEPPVALLLYHPKDPNLASFYPFACFSPEWQAIQYGLKQGIPVRFMDMPATHKLAIREQEKEQAPAERTPSAYPLDQLARIAGYENTDLWWEHQFELPDEEEAHFEAVLEAMTALREDSLEEDAHNQIREAFMRSILSQAEKEQEAVAVPGPTNGCPMRVDMVRESILLVGMSTSG